MSEDNFSESMDSGGSYPRTESTMITPEKLDERIDDILHNAGIVGEEEDDLYPTQQETRKERINQLLKNVGFEDEDTTEKKLIQEDAKITRTPVISSGSLEEEIEASESFEVLKREGFSRRVFERIEREISEIEEEVL